MSRYIEVAEKKTLNVIPLRNIVVFPSVQISFEVNDSRLTAVCEKAQKDGSRIFFVCRKDDENLPLEECCLRFGTVARVKQYLALPDGSARVLAEGESRAAVVSFAMHGDVLTADVVTKNVSVEDEDSVRGEAYVRRLHRKLDDFARFVPRISSDLLMAAKSINVPAALTDFVGCHVLADREDKQLLLQECDPMRRCEMLDEMLDHELKVLELDSEIGRKTRESIEAQQRAMYLREQMKVISRELEGGGGPDGEGGDYMPPYGSGDAEIDEYYKKIDDLHLPDEIHEKLCKEVGRMAKTPFGSAEASVLKSYLDICLEIPWKKVTRDRLDIEAASKILEADHDGLEKVKQRILEFLAVKQLSPDLKNQIICLVGPPGTGKTSIVASIARAMKRRYVRVSLGGVRDEADIRGHRKTYIGSMPGRIIDALIKAGVRNPIILLDEVDKLTRDAHGDPSSALLEVLDSEQNKAFRDHFVELPVDLGDCMFIATANTLETVPAPLIDRMEIIELKIYTRHEKLSIARNHLIPKQLKRHGLNKRMLRITDDAVEELIDYYTEEAGVRNLERELANLCRKAAKKIVEAGDDAKRIDITAADIKDYLGRRKVKPDRISDENEVGVVNGLAYTELGGDILKIEASAMPGTGKLELTGSLGDVMKESAHIAVSYIRAHADELKVDPEFYKSKDIHIHVPEGAVPKDGPSAGVSITTALTSELSGHPVRRDVAMTGEITLRGKVIPIGGLKEKTMAAYKAGVRTVLIPADNMDDLEDIDPIVREKLEFIPCRRLEDVLSRAIVE